ncbi:MAG: ABC transporter permease subunit [Chloroflexota bacterium]
MIRTLLVVTRLTINEAARRKILWGALLLAVLFLAVYGIGFYYLHLDFRGSTSRKLTLVELNEFYNFLLMAGLYAINFLTVVMSGLTSVNTLSGEIASGTIQTLVSKPVRRWEILFGKWFGFVVMLTTYLVLLAGGTMAIVFCISGYVAPHALRGLGLMWLNSMLLLSVSLLGGTMLSTLANGVLAFGLYGVSFIGGWIEYVGGFVENQTAINVGIISSLIFPSEALWKRAAFEMQSPLVASLGFSPFSTASVPSLLMVWYGFFYAVVVLIFAVRIFARRDF